MQQNVIISKIVERLRSQIVPGTTADWNNTEWTANVLRELCTVGKDHFDCKVWTTGHPAGADGGEWLYDQTWTYCEFDDWTKHGWSIPMVAECEWARNLDAVQEDFEKLLQARADVRVMIIDAAGWKDGIKSRSIALQLYNWVSLFQGSKRNDAYLIVAYEEELAPWNWRFFVILSNGYGKPAVLQDITP